MKTRLAAIALALGLTAASALPALAAVTVRDANGVAHLNLESQIIPQLGVGAYEGSLSLTISPDGIIQGEYRPDEGSRFETVTGGLDGKNIWLDIGFQGRLHVSGTLDGDHIVGSTVIGTRFYDFKALPIRN